LASDTINPKVKRAWRDYREELRGLKGMEYEMTEPMAWANLQAALAQARPRKGRAVRSAA
jgi:hypothetical protein